MLISDVFVFSSLLEGGMFMVVSVKTNLRLNTADDKQQPGYRELYRKPLMLAGKFPGAESGE
jgi:hypothetical protein